MRRARKWRDPRLTTPPEPLRRTYEWAVVSHAGEALGFTVARTRRESLRQFITVVGGRGTETTFSLGGWRYWQRRGYAAMRVRIMPVQFGGRPVRQTRGGRT